MSIKLVTKQKIAETSSKGNQEKWLEGNRWYKLDLFGYEGLAETVTSSLLAHTNVNELGFRFVRYRVERLQVHRRPRLGCSSQNFLKDNESIMAVSELLRKGIGSGWQTTINRLPNIKSKVAWIAKQVTHLTGLERFGAYLTLLFEIDMLFCNEDRHLNNIAVLRRGEGFDYCPIFDFGAGLLSNTRDYPMNVEPKSMVGNLRALPMDCIFARQVHAAQDCFGPQLRCDFAVEDVKNALDESLSFYAQRDIPYIQERVNACIDIQWAKLFH